jgi:hypothetical protein
MYPGFGDMNLGPIRAGNENRLPTTPPPKNVERVIYEYVDREKSSVFFMLTT